MPLTVGDLTAAHLGETFTLDVPEGLWGGDNPITAPLSRVQHDGPTTDPLGAEQPARTLVSLGPCGVTLDPTHPIELVEGGTNG